MTRRAATNGHVQTDQRQPTEQELELVRKTMALERAVVSLQHCATKALRPAALADSRLLAEIVAFDRHLLALSESLEEVLPGIFDKAKAVRERKSAAEREMEERRKVRDEEIGEAVLRKTMEHCPKGYEFGAIDDYHDDPQAILFYHLAYNHVQPEDIKIVRGHYREKENSWYEPRPGTPVRLEFDCGGAMIFHKKAEDAPAKQVQLDRHGRGRRR